MGSFYLAVFGVAGLSCHCKISHASGCWRDDQYGQNVIRRNARSRIDVRLLKVVSFLFRPRFKGSSSFRTIKLSTSPAVALPLQIWNCVAWLD